MNDNPKRYVVPHGRWTMIPYTGIAVFQATGTSITATATYEDVVLDTDEPVRIRLAEVTGTWYADRVVAEEVGAR